ncbi:glycosyltransferase [Duganella sp. FT50W]|uniref:Glycosyltransferase n=2 Tax=Duganella lactea TaxID=2692173 RepID=A0A6L8MQN6_9BURK|nr:glycosyltransferase [Duganella lactea]
MTKFVHREARVKVLHIIVGLNVGGAEMMLLRLVTANPNTIAETVVVSLTELGVVGAMLRERGVAVHTLGLSSARQVPLVAARLIALIRRNRPAIVQTWMYHADLLGGVAARLAGVKRVIWGVRTTDIGAGQGNRRTVAVRWLCARLSGIVPSVIVCAAEASRQLHVALGYCAARMEVIPNGFDLQRLQPGPESDVSLRQELGLPPEQPVVGCVGRFHPVKDHENFVHAAGLLLQRFPSARFLLVGRDCDTGNAQLMAWLEQAGARGRFVLLGQRDDIPRCLAAMDIFCLSSRSEGFPNVVGEAMAMRRPCVVTDVGDAAYLVGGQGVVVPKENAAALAAGLGQLLSLSAAERAQLGQRAHERIAAHFTIERTRERFAGLYARLSPRMA